MLPYSIYTGTYNYTWLPFLVTCSVRIRLFDVPEVVKSGHDVVLNCDYDLQRQRLYMVKWYKGTHEFYR